MLHKKVIYLIAAYTVLFTFPVIFFLNSKIPGKYADTYQVWGKTFEFQNRIHDEGIINTVVWQFRHLRLSPIEASGWLQKIVTPHVGYNLVWLFSFFMAAVGMYLLVYYLTKNRAAGIISALIFSFSPFHITQATATNFGTMHYEWIPFFILFLIRFFRGLKLKDFIWMMVFLFLIALTEHQLLAFTLVFTIIFTVCYLIKNRKIFLHPKIWIYSLSGVVVLLVLVKLLFGGLLKVTESQDNYLDPGSDQVRRYSADAIDFFIPSSLHPFWGDKYNYMREDTEANSEGRKSSYIGYGVIILSLLSLMAVKRRTATVLFFFGNAILFSILALGPYLHWKGSINESVLMPYTLLYKYVPFWYIIRTVNRIYVIALLCFAVAAGIGMDAIMRTIAERKKRIALLALSVFVVSLEYLSLPVPMMSMEYSGFYDRLAKETGSFSILDIPGSTSYDYSSRLMFYNQIHRKNNLANMDFARVVEDHWSFQQTTPIISDLLYSLPTGGKPPSKEIINDYYYSLATKILNYYHVNYLVVSKAYQSSPDKRFDGEAFENTIYFVDGQIDTDMVYEDEHLVAYQVKQSDYLDGWFLAMDLTGDYWGEKEGVKGSVARWARDGAKMKLVNMAETPQNIDLSFTTSIKNLRKIEVYLNDTKVGAFRINEKKEKHSISLDQVKPGENVITFKILDQDGKPIETYELNRGVRFSDVRTMAAKR